MPWIKSEGAEPVEISAEALDIYERMKRLTCTCPPRARVRAGAGRAPAKGASMTRRISNHGCFTAVRRCICRFV